MRAVALILFAFTAAGAGGACAQASADAPLPAVTAWNGTYVGVNAGGMYKERTRFDRAMGFQSNNTTALSLGLRPTQYDLNDSGFIGGAQIGYNYVLSNMSQIAGGGVLVGGEADIDYTDISHTVTQSNTTNYGPLDTPGATAYTRVNQFSSRLDYLGTVRGRLGLAYSQFLVYGTGGFAYGNVRRRITFYGPNAPTTPFFQGDNDGTKTGYVYGGGVEYAVPTSFFLTAVNFVHASAVTFKAEWLHYDLGRDTLTYPGVNGGSTIGGYTSRVHTNGDLARLGLNYKF